MKIWQKNVDKKPNWHIWGTGQSWWKTKYSDKVLNWCDSDNESRFKFNMKTHKNKMEKLGWTRSSITYSFNTQSFRSDSFRKKCSILFNGCSQTMGTGLPLEKTWTGQVANHYGVNYHNIAIAGSDWNTIAQRSVHWLPKLKPKVHIIKAPPTTRFNWWRDQELLGSSNMSQQELMKNKIAVDLTTLGANYEWFRYSAMTVIETMCKDLDIKLLYVPMGRIHKLNTDDLARDLVHWGCIENNHLADWVIEKMKERKYENFIN
jgi:hypothetical protein